MGLNFVRNRAGNLQNPDFDLVIALIFIILPVFSSHSAFPVLAGLSIRYTPGNVGDSDGGEVTLPPPPPPRAIGPTSPRRFSHLRNWARARRIFLPESALSSVGCRRRVALGAGEGASLIEAGCSGSWRWRPEWGASGSLIGEAAAAAALYGPAPRGPPSGREPSWFPRGSLGAAPPPPSRRRRTRSPSGRGQRGGFSPLLVKAAEDGGGPPPLALTATSDRRCLGPAARSPALLSLLPPICPPAAAAEKWAAVLGFLFQGLLSARNRALVL